MEPDMICVNGNFIPFHDATVHILSPAMKYGLCVFEGIRAYQGSSNLFVFRLAEHLERLAHSAKATQLDAIPDCGCLEDALIESLRRNRIQSDAHIRLQLWVDGMNGPIASTGPVSWAIATVPCGDNLTNPKNVSMGISSWIRPSGNAFPALVKTSANYMVGRLAALQAKAAGYDAAVLLNANGFVAEAPAMSLFIVTGGSVATPPLYDNILASITRDTLTSIFRNEMGLTVSERSISPSELYTADEIMLCGTANEIQAVTKVDGRRIGDGAAGVITMAAFTHYMDIARGRETLHANWRVAVYEH
ncbi:branched-chain-amino-acid transaminase [Sinorhizobium meliloti]|uniref:branched-chain-amino-acid transaminase n=1 Tax=Rhizobium meliloti TaxID=382 RepID=UPI0004A444DD|nr:branched-chain-amino-acid transaminase [Sinorhizobium meliloti]ARS65909.1 branched-chain amino acid aminotransferase [Sinorhizobium meliloti RU11/001]RVG85630.1 branched-chain-amino-acid transaminase [Sinorhizobium meliloti]RVH56714.1 branched-chain-amino-acid transaminase [Sinorhizobium meliloti]